MLKFIHRYIRRFIVWINTPSDEESHEYKMNLAHKRLSWGMPARLTYRGMDIAARREAERYLCEAARNWDHDPEVVKAHLKALA